METREGGRGTHGGASEPFFFARLVDYKEFVLSHGKNNTTQNPRKLKLRCTDNR